MREGSRKLPPQYAHAVRDGIASVATQFKLSPASFLYESDLQSLLFSRLFDALAPCALVRHPEASDWGTIARGRPPTINPVKSEYPDSTRFDIAVLDPNSDPAANAWNQPVRVAIELKFRQANGGGPGFVGDRDKLAAYRARANGRGFTGISLVFCHREHDEELDAWSERERLIVDPKVFEPPDDDFIAWAVTPAFAPR